MNYNVYSGIGKKEDFSFYKENRNDNILVIKKQTDQLELMKEKFIEMRSKYHEEKRNNSLKVLTLQKQISSAKKKSQQLEIKIFELKEKNDNELKQKLAEEVIENIWSIMNDFRQTLFKDEESIEFKESNFIIDFEDSLNNTPIISLDTPIINNISPKKIEKPQIKIEKSPKNIEKSPFEGSIAERRTKRNKKDVYYKEPSLKGSLTPGDPYTFSTEEGIITPTIPNGYNRHYQKNRK